MDHRIVRLAAGTVLAAAIAGCAGSPSASSAGTGSAPTGSLATGGAPAGSVAASAAAAPVTAPATPTINNSAPGGLPSLPALFSSHSAPDLESLLPQQVGGITLTTYSVTLDELLASGSSDPAAVEAFLQSLGKTRADASFAGAFDPTSTLGGGIQAYKVAGADPAPLLAGFVSLAQEDVGTSAAVSQGTVGGKNVTVVSAGSGPNDTQWLYARGDVVFTVLGPDEATAGQYLAALP